MPEIMQNLVAEARKNKFSSIPKLTDEDIISIWDTVFEYVDVHMRSQKGVTIHGFGTFTFATVKLDIGNNKYVLLQRPVFLISEKFAQTHALQYTKYHITGEIPNIPLNFTAISVESGFARDTVEACVREILQSLSRAVGNQRNVEFLFRGIGVLYIKDYRVKTRFFKDFVNIMDSTGGLLNLMEKDILPSCMANAKEFKRPGTADSIMSTQTTLSAQGRPGTSTLTFPRLNGARDMLPPIRESATPRHDKGHAPKPRGRPLTPTDEEEEEPVVGVGIKPCDDVIEEVVTDEDDANRVPTPPQRIVSRASKSAPGFDPSGSVTSPRKSDELPEPEAPEGPKPSTSVPLRAESVARSTGSRQASSGHSSSCSSPSHHHRAGQELCYVCMQRTMRNIPVSFAKERKRKEMEQDALLQQYQQMKDHEALLLEKASTNSMRQSLQKVAAYNLGVAQGVKEAKHARNTEFIKSYVFQHRPLTPLRFYKQEEYNKALETQVKMKRTREEKHMLDRKFQERLEQVQLAEDLAAQRERFLREKAEQMSQYQRALSAQVRDKELYRKGSGGWSVSLPFVDSVISNKRSEEKKRIASIFKKIRSKPLPLPKAEPDSAEPVFGRNDAVNAKLLEKKERSRTVLKDQLNTISEKKKNVILQQLTAQKEENDMLARTKQELIADRVGAQRRSYGMRKALEKNWKDHYRSKLEKEDEERSRMKTPGMLLLQQTDPYRRCGQCQRNTGNCGESNIWSESRYIPGSRLMV